MFLGDFDAPRTDACVAPFSFPEARRRRQDETREVRTFGPCGVRFCCELYFDAGDPRGLCEVQDEEAAKHARGGVGEETAAAACGVARAEEDDGLCKSYVEGILVRGRLGGCGHEWLAGVCVWWERRRMEGVSDYRRGRKQLRGRIETGAVPGLQFFHSGPELGSRSH